MKTSTVWIMAASCGLIVANNYYNQPLLAEIAKNFSVSDTAAGEVSVLTQAGYTFGMLLFLPLGDMLERRRLISLLLIVASSALAGMALAPNLFILQFFAFIVGFTSVGPQLLVPFSAQLSSPNQRGHIVGRLMSGLFIGILVSRTISGFIGAHFGWRSMFWIGAGIMVATNSMLFFSLPRSKPVYKGKWAGLMASLWALVKRHPELRRVSYIGALHFGAFSAFWTTLSFFLSTPPYHYGPAVAGLFGLVGVAGALAAPQAGKLADRLHPTRIIQLGTFIIIIAYGLLFLGNIYIFSVVLGVILLDLGMQSAHVSNMTYIYSLPSDAYSRLNTVYMVSRFAGGAIGSSLGAYAWSFAHWTGVCTVGILLAFLSLTVQRSTFNIPRDNQ
ncbi:MAG: MFS transporter [Proteobacteria bacterium]|nr:MFS transporter [Pseudomonadota bacterium]MDE3208519.1 MFS transporter [Pseudomonadota bacterium]